jgi:hypothetical protein
MRCPAQQQCSPAGALAQARQLAHQVKLLGLIQLIRQRHPHGISRCLLIQQRLLLFSRSIFYIAAAKTAGSSGSRCTAGSGGSKAPALAGVPQAAAICCR